MIENPPSEIGSAVNTIVPALPCLTAFVTASRMISTDYSPYLKLTADGKPETITSYKMVAEEFETRLHTLLESLYNPEIPFAQTCDKETCINCDYNRICKR